MSKATMSLVLVEFLGFARELLTQDKYFFLVPFCYKDLPVRKWIKNEEKI